MASVPWTEDQVRSLSPDASSFSAARRLVSRLRDTGTQGDAIWGLCQGSGSRPYQTVVDVSGPAYKCSCPSRKFPCKHALSLLLAWASGAVPQADSIANFALEWISARSAKKSDRDAAAPKNVNPATVEQRRMRVTAGLAELDVWLTDQVRAGLAHSDRSFTAFEAIAARMVDAQAPAIAATLRQLPTAVVTKTHWPEILLREYARLHLLVRAHRTLDTLPAPTQAGVRSHVGYPMRAETVRAEPQVRDRWMVLARRTTEENQLHTRRSWLYGRATKRWAMLVEHSFGTPSFSGEVPAPGAEIDADVHYYPGAVPLRAQWGATHGPRQPFTTIPHPAGTIAATLDAHADALAADPWLRSWPTLLTDVTPAASGSNWQLVDAEGTALPLSAGARPWSLLAISGGHPVTVIGDWTADGFEPASVFAAGQVFDATPDRAPAEAAARPQFADLVSIALIGTARRSPEHAHLDGPVAEFVKDLEGEPATRLLEAAALQYLYLRGGELPTTAMRPIPAADDDRLMLPRAAADRLADLLASRSQFLPEWFSAAAPFDYRLPPARCVQALWAAVSDPKLRGPLLRMAGPRGRWLAEQNPEWSKLLDSFTGVTEDAWLYGTAPERLDWFTDLRRRDPAAARETLVAGWAKESGPLKAELLAALGDGLSLADEPLMESALDDRRADVRSTAARLLSRLPGSAFEQRMSARLQRWVHVDDQGNLTVELPAELDDTARRDGITDDRLRQVIAASPLSVWPTVRTLPEQFRTPILNGWIDAALSQRNSRWAAALFGEHRRIELFTALDPDEQIRQACSADTKDLVPLLPALGHPWPDAVAEHVFGLLARRARSSTRYFEAPERALLGPASTHSPVSFGPRFEVLAQSVSDPTWQQAFQRIAHNLAERATMLEELM